MQRKGNTKRAGTRQFADRLEVLIGAQETDKEYRYMLGRALCAFIHQLININTPAAAELARAVYLAGIKAWDRNRREVTGRVEGSTHGCRIEVFDLQDMREQLTRHQHMVLCNTIESEEPRLYEVRHSKRHAGLQDILIETDDARRSCGIERGDTVYFDAMGITGQPLQTGDIAGRYWRESGRPGWQTFIGRIEIRDGQLVTINDLGEHVIKDDEYLYNITAIEKPVGRARAKFIEAEEEWPDVIGEEEGGAS
jgi:hypothetical protein